MLSRLLLESRLGRYWLAIREDAEAARPHVFGNCGLLVVAPRGLADREQRQDARLVYGVNRQRTHIVDPCRGETLDFGNLRDRG